MTNLSPIRAFGFKLRSEYIDFNTRVSIATTKLTDKLAAMTGSKEIETAVRSSNGISRIACAEGAALYKLLGADMFDPAVTVREAFRQLHAWA